MQANAARPTSILDFMDDNSLPKKCEPALATLYGQRISYQAFGVAIAQMRAVSAASGAGCPEPLEDGRLSPIALLARKTDGRLTVGVRKRTDENGATALPSSGELVAP
jgi:hypothetical protein